MDPRLQVTTVITKAGNKSPIVASLKAEGAEVWSDQHIRASYKGVKSRFPKSQFKDMRSLYGRHEGQTVFVCGAGPSLKDCPEKLPGPTFAINRAIKHVKADYFCFSDMKATRDSGDHPNAKAAEWAFGSALHIYLLDKPGYLIEANANPSAYTVEEDRPVYFNGATFSWVTHWAIKSGAKRVVFIGCEFSGNGYYDGAPLLDTGDFQCKVISEVSRIRVEDMFGPDKAEWFDPAVELLDASNGFLPIPKAKLEDVL